MSHELIARLQSVHIYRYKGHHHGTYVPGAFLLLITASEFVSSISSFGTRIAAYEIIPRTRYHQVPVPAHVLQLMFVVVSYLVTFTGNNPRDKKFRGHFPRNQSGDGGPNEKGGLGKISSISVHVRFNRRVARRLLALQ